MWCIKGRTYPWTNVSSPGCSNRLPQSAAMSCRISAAIILLWSFVEMTSFWNASSSFLSIQVSSGWFCSSCKVTQVNEELLTCHKRLTSRMVLHQLETTTGNLTLHDCLLKEGSSWWKTLFCGPNANRYTWCKDLVMLNFSRCQRQFSVTHSTRRGERLFFDFLHVSMKQFLKENNSSLMSSPSSNHCKQIEYDRSKKKRNLTFASSATFWQYSKSL